MSMWPPAGRSAAPGAMSFRPPLERPISATVRPPRSAPGDRDPGTVRSRPPRPERADPRRVAASPLVAALFPEAAGATRP